MVFTQTYVYASVEFGSALTNNNAATRNQFTAVSFNTKAFRF
jgi:hypothetical protein